MSTTQTATIVQAPPTLTVLSESRRLMPDARPCGGAAGEGIACPGWRGSRDALGRADAAMRNPSEPRLKAAGVFGVVSTQR